MRFGRLALVLGFAASAGAAACSFGGEDTGASNDEITVTGDVSQVLKSTFVLETGCMAVKVGPKQLLLAARCVADNAAFATGKSVGFTLASGTVALASTASSLSPGDAGAGTDAAAKDAGAAPSPKDAGAPRTLKTITIASVDVHPSFLSKCSGDACGFDTLAASDARDIAVITVSDALDTITTIPVDLDTVGQSDPLLAVSSGCATFSAKAGTSATTKTLAVPARLVNHDGSPYLRSPALVSRLAAGYVVTPGLAWRATDAHLCAANIGAPLFRGTQAAVAGITSNFTAYDMRTPVPVTIHHTRVDVGSKVGPWLQEHGVETTRSCSTADQGCAKRGYDGGAPRGERAVTSETTTPASDAGPGDGGARASDGGDAGPVSTGLPDKGTPAPFVGTSNGDSPDTDPTANANSDPGEDDDAGPSTKKKADASGCSASPGAPASASLAGIFGVALALSGLRRRRSSTRARS